MGERYKRTIYFIVKTFMAITCIFPLGYFLLEYIDLHTHAPWFGETSGWDTCYTILSTILGVLLVIEIIEFLLLSVYLARYLAARYKKKPILWEVMALYLGLFILLVMIEPRWGISESMTWGIFMFFLFSFGVLSLYVFGIIILLDDDKDESTPKTDSAVIFSHMADNNNPRRALSVLLKAYPIAVILWFSAYFLCEYTNNRWYVDIDITVKIYQAFLLIVCTEFLLICSYFGNYLATRYGKTPICLESVFSFFGACILFRVTYNLSPKENLLALLILEVCAVVIFRILSLIDKKQK